MVFLPEELLVQIFSRAPVRDLVIFRSVCKRWRSLIDDPGFVSTHLNNYKSNSEGTHLLAIKQRRFWKRHQQVSVRSSDTFRKVTVLNNGLNNWLGDGNYSTLGYVNGVMLIKKRIFGVSDDIILWNPSINTSLNISNPTFLNMPVYTRFEFGLGFDATSNDLKVVAIVYPHATYCGIRRYAGKIPGHVHVYALSTKSWSRYNGVHPPPYWSEGRQVFVNGGIHWMNLGPEIRHDNSWREITDSHIVSFDVSNEVFSYFELPSEVIEDRDGEKIKDGFPIVLEGSLGMFYTYESHYKVWVMDEYGVPNSWSKRYKFELQIDKFLHFNSNGELLFALKGEGIKSYDCKRNSVKDLPKNLFSIFML